MREKTTDPIEPRISEIPPPYLMIVISGRDLPVCGRGDGAGGVGEAEFKKDATVECACGGGVEFAGLTRGAGEGPEFDEGPGPVGFVSMLWQEGRLPEGRVGGGSAIS